MADETVKSWLDKFLEQAEESVSSDRVGGTLATVRLGSGFFVYGTEENQFFEGGTSDKANDEAHTEAVAHATALGVAKNISFGMRVTVIGGTQYPDPKAYGSDDGNLSKTVLPFSSKNPAPAEGEDTWENPGRPWKVLLESFEGDNPVTPEMMGGDFYAHVAYKQHPYFDIDNVDTHIRHVAQTDSDGELRLDDEGKAQPEYLIYIKAGFATREEMIEYAYGLGVEGGDVSDVDAPPPAEMWIGVEGWADVWPDVRVALEKVASKPSKPVLAKAKSSLEDNGVAESDFQALYEWMAENPA